MRAASDAEPIKFGTDGWRGIIAKDFTFANVCKVTRAIAGYLETTYSKNRPILISYDPRFLAEQFAQNAANLLSDLGWNVKLSDRDCPTPAIAYHAKYQNTAGALMFTASHNPPQYGGLKYIPDYAGPATQAITDAIVANLNCASDAPTGQNPARISTFDPKPDYLNFLYTLLDVERIRQAKLKVKYDALYSTSRGYLDEALAHCGCQTESFHTYRDVLFGGGIPEPKGEQLAGLVEAVKKDWADVGLATDGDSDRFGIVDELGNILPGNAILLLLTQHLIRNKGKTGAIVRTVATTHLLDNLAAIYGLPVYETAVGFKHIGEKMRETSVLIGGEESGGLSILGHIPEKDGILAALLVVEVMAYEGKPLSQLVADVIAQAGGLYTTQRTDLNLDNNSRTILEAFTQNPPQEVAGIAVKKIGRQDGIKLYLEDGSWVLLRPSGTEPLMRVYLETNSLEKQAKISQHLEDTLTRLLPA